jgi:hypothetical protein
LFLDYLRLTLATNNIFFLWDKLPISAWADVYQNVISFDSDGSILGLPNISFPTWWWVVQRPKGSVIEMYGGAQIDLVSG